MVQHSSIDHTGVVASALSYGSNANAVAGVSAGGAASTVSRGDHVHDGVTSISHTSNTFDGPVTFTASGSLGITSPSAGTLNFSAVDTAGGGSSVTIQTFHGCSIFHSTTQTNPSAVAFDSENYDTDAYHSTVTNNTRVTIPAGLGGLYDVKFASLANASVTVRLRKGGTTIIGPNYTADGAGTVAYIPYNVTVELAAGDYIEMAVSGNATFGHASAYEAQSQMTVTLIGQ